MANNHDKRKSKPQHPTLDEILQRLPDAHEQGRGYRASCPAHRGDNPSALILSPGENGRPLIHCHAHGCAYEDVLRALGFDVNGRTPRTNRETGYTQTPRPVKLSESEKATLSLVCREAMGLMCGPLPDSPTDHEVIGPYGGILELLWDAYAEGGHDGHDAAKSAFIAMRPDLAVAAPKLLRALDRRLSTFTGQPVEKATAQAPRTKRLSELMAMTFPEAEMVVEGVLPEGLTVLAGAPKVGKSRLALDVALAASFGGKALGRIPVKAGPVLYVSLEDHERRLQVRAGTMLMDAAAPESFEYATAWRRADEGGLDDLDAWLQAHPGARLVVIDTLKRWRPRPTRGQSVYDLDYDALAGLTDLCHRYPGLAILVLHHTNKMREVDDVMDLVSGSTGLTGAADGFAVLRKRRGEHEAVLHVTHRDLTQDAELAVRSDPLTGGWTLLGDASAQPSTPEQQQILGLMAVIGTPMKPNDIAAQLDKSPNSVQLLMGKLLERGLVRRASYGRYALAEQAGEPQPHEPQPGPDPEPAIGAPWLPPTGNGGRPVACVNGHTLADNQRACLQCLASTHGAKGRGQDEHHTERLRQAHYDLRGADDDGGRGGQGRPHRAKADDAGRVSTARPG